MNPVCFFIVPFGRKKRLVTHKRFVTLMNKVKKPSNSFPFHFLSFVTSIISTLKNRSLTKFVIVDFVFIPFKKKVLDT